MLKQCPEEVDGARSGAPGGGDPDEEETLFSLRDQTPPHHLVSGHLTGQAMDILHPLLSGHLPLPRLWEGHVVISVFQVRKLNLEEKLTTCPKSLSYDCLENPI